MMPRSYDNAGEPFIPIKQLIAMEMEIYTALANLL